MTYKNMMAKIEDGDMEVNAWSSAKNENGRWEADVTIYKSNGTSTRKVVVVTGVPADQNR